MSDDQARILITLNPEWTAARRAFPELPLIVFVTPTSTSDGMKLVQAFFGDSSSCAATKHLQTHKVSLESIQALDANVVIIYYTKLHGGHFGKMTPLSPDDQRNRVKLEAAKRADKVGTYIRFISLLLFSPASSTVPRSVAAEFLSIVANIMRCRHPQQHVLQQMDS
jgi:hypothetical protein